MKWFSSLCVFAVSVVLAGAIATASDDQAPATQPSGSEHKEEAKAPAARGGRWGFAPYNKLNTLTEEQKAQITAIHRKALDEKKAIEQREEEEIMAVLTDENKAELEKLLADEKAEKKAKAAEKRQQKKDEDKDK